MKRVLMTAMLVGLSGAVWAEGVVPAPAPVPTAADVSASIMAQIKAEKAAMHKKMQAMEMKRRATPPYGGGAYPIVGDDGESVSEFENCLKIGKPEVVLILETRKCEDANQRIKWKVPTTNSCGKAVELDVTMNGLDNDHFPVGNEDSASQYVQVGSDYVTGGNTFYAEKAVDNLSSMRVEVRKGGRHSDNPPLMITEIPVKVISK